MAKLDCVVISPAIILLSLRYKSSRPFLFHKGSVPPFVWICREKSVVRFRWMTSGGMVAVRHPEP
jgi:hypothetical protein